MGCVNPDGTVSTAARAVLQAMQDGATAADAASAAGLPLFRVRASLRELVDGALVTVEGDLYTLTERGRDALEHA